MRGRFLIASIPLGLTLGLVAGCSTTPSATRSPSTPSATSSPSSVEPSHRAELLRVSTLGWRLPTPTSRQALTDLGGGRVLLAGGMLAGDTSTPSTYRIDLGTGKTTRMPALKVPVHDAAGGRFAGAPAVFGGGNATEQSVVQGLEHGAWRKVDAFPTTRSDLSAITVSGATVLLGGYDGSAVPRTIFAQRGRDRMRPIGRLVRGVRYAATALLGGEVYVFGGEVSGSELSTVQRVDLSTGRSRVVSSMPHALGHAMAAVVGGRVLLMGGRLDPRTPSDRMWWFDPSSGRFSRAGRLPRPLTDAAVATAGSRVYLLGGEDPDVTDHVVRIEVG